MIQQYWLVKVQGEYITARLLSLNIIYSLDGPDSLLSDMNNAKLLRCEKTLLFYGRYRNCNCFCFYCFQTSDLKIADNYYIKFDVPIDVDTIHTAKRNEKHPCQKC